MEDERGKRRRSDSPSEPGNGKPQDDAGHGDAIMQEFRLHVEWLDKQQAIQNGEAPPAAGNSLGRFSSPAQRSGSVDPEAAATPAQQLVSSDATSTSLAILTPTTELLRVVNRVQSLAAERAQGQQLIQQQAASLQLPIWPPVPIMPDASFAHPTPQPLDGHQSGQLLQPSAGMGFRGQGMGQVAKPGPGPARQDPSVQSGGEGEAPAKRRRKIAYTSEQTDILETYYFMGKLDTKQGREEAAMAVSGYRSTTGSNTVGRLVSLEDVTAWRHNYKKYLIAKEARNNSAGPAGSGGGPDSRGGKGL